MAGAIQETNIEKRFQELGLESLQNYKIDIRLCLFYKISKDHNLPNFIT